MAESPEAHMGHMASMKAGDIQGAAGPPGPEPKKVDWRTMEKLEGGEAGTEAIMVGPVA